MDHFGAMPAFALGRTRLFSKAVPMRLAGIGFVERTLGLSAADFRIDG
jgi:hypothetical protein